MKIYTKTGDGGQTALFGGARVSKASLRVAAYGDVDALNSHLGVACAHTLDPELAALLRGLQNQLFALGAELAKNPAKDVDVGVPPVSDRDIARLEVAIDQFEAELSPLKSFILPGGAPAAAFLHVARTSCRRAERATVALAEVEPVRGEVIRYLNRLSDLLFVLARLANHRARVEDVPWLGREGA